jgi:hypothetical protein
VQEATKISPPKAPAPPTSARPTVAPPPEEEDTVGTIAMSVPAQKAPAAGPPKATKILEVRLQGPGFDLTAKEPGAHELGRSTEAPLRVNHPTVSRKHARIILSDDRGIVYVQDAGGANGTRLNGKAIEKLAPLSDGDRVGVGEVELTVSLKRG